MAKTVVVSTPSDLVPPEPWTRFLRQLKRRQVQLVGAKAADAALARYLKMSPRWVKNCLDGLDQSGRDEVPAIGYKLSTIEKALTGTPYTLVDVFPEDVVERLRPTSTQDGYCPLCVEVVPTVDGRCCWCRAQSTGDPGLAA